jgi:hypothetical protein
MELPTYIDLCNLKSDIYNLLLIDYGDNFTDYNIQNSSDKIIIDYHREKFNNYLEMSDIKTFITLFSNYNSDTSIEEFYDEDKQSSINNFLNVLQNKSYFKNISVKYNINIDQLIYHVEHMFFDLYNNTTNDILNTCAFEHIFIGETYGDKVLGFHSWIQLFKKINDNQISDLNIHKYINVINDDKLYSSVNDKLYSSVNDKFNHTIINCSMKINSNMKKKDTIILGINPYIEVCIYLLIYLYTKQSNLQKYTLELSDVMINIDFKLGIHHGYFRTCYSVFNVK